MKILTTIIVVISIAIACTKGGKLERISGDQYTITSNASSKQLVPVIDTTSSGTFTGFYDEQSNTLSFTITWNDLWRTASKDTITSVAFYGPANAATNGVLVRLLPFVSTNNAASANLGLAGIKGFTMSEAAALLEGAYYFTINTKKFPNGIIRGQLAATKQ
ncbi:CHRD domain-containing protein [Longitalea arenae]|uniref:CHRD domain-containing protein n=1 Tax=Longitalea arenae TaxID=2812558 RepID=UPI001967C59E|nr:CHRD domain-containing protein [Longitalea arenae]